MPQSSIETANLQAARRYLAAIEAGATGDALAAFFTEDVVQAGVDRVALELVWTGTLAFPVGSLPAGGEMRASFAVFLEFRNGRIAAQRNYDCFDPF